MCKKCNCNQKDKAGEDSIRNDRRFFLLFFVCSLLFGCCAIINTPDIVAYWSGISDVPRSLGEFGDQFGMTNAFFSGLAFAGIVVAVLMQSKDLAMQRRELQHTREVLEEHSAELQRQAVSAERQRFEGTFFQLVQLHHELAAAIRITRTNGELIRGRIAVSKIASMVGKCIPQLISGKIVTDTDLENRRVVINAGYMPLFNENLRNIVGHYFRNLYTIVKYIEDSSVDGKQDYIRILRAQLSEAELFVLFYNCVSDMGSQKFMPLASKYHLFDNLRSSILRCPDDRAFTSSSMAD